MELKIHYMDPEILVCEKPSGTLSEGDSPISLPTILCDLLRQRGEDGALFPVHRLDKETTGLVVLARTQRAAAELSRSITEGLFQKEYLAAICGTPQESEGCWTDLLFYDRNRGKSFVVDRKRGGVKEATLSYRVIESDGNRSVVRVRLHTGRTHQIRVQFSSRGLPLVGDRRYGAPAEEGRQLMLHAAYLQFPHPKSGKSMEFFSLPCWEGEVLKKS